MEVTILGSGTATPQLARNASGLAVRTGTCTILVDMGPGTMRRMCEAAIDAKDIDIILLTHFHPDHVCDLVAFLFASNYSFGPVREQFFHLVGPEGLEQYFAGLVGVYGDWIVPKGNRLIRKELNARMEDGLTVRGVHIRSIPSRHVSPSLSYRIEADHRSVTVSGDTDFSEFLIDLAQGTDLLITECSMPEGRKVPGHLVPSEAGRIAASARVGKLVLTHLYPPCDEADIVAQAARQFDGPIAKAQDLMVIEA